VTSTLLTVKATAGHLLTIRTSPIINQLLAKAIFNSNNKTKDGAATLTPQRQQTTFSIPHSSRTK